MNIVAILLFGALGGITRYICGDSIYATLCINLIGSFGLGYYITLAHLKSHNPLWTNGIATGFIGSFTTFSSFMIEVIQIDKTHELYAIVYLIGSVIAGMGLCWLGIQCAHVLHRVHSTVKVPS